MRAMDGAAPALSWRSPKKYVRPSPIQGRGLFVKEPIAKGEIVAVKGGYVLDLRDKIERGRARAHD